MGAVLLKREVRALPTPHIDPLTLLAPRWVLPVLERLRDGPHRYTELLHCVQHDRVAITDKALAATLHDLQAHQLVEHPPTRACPYRLTYLGHGLLDQYDRFAGWVRTHLGPAAVAAGDRRPVAGGSDAGP